jgi:hypothetical protein
MNTLANPARMARMVFKFITKEIKLLKNLLEIELVFPDARAEHATVRRKRWR